MKIISAKAKVRKISRARIIRAIASSTAIETGQPVRVIEAKLKCVEPKFDQLTLAS